jgi:DUF917 family protein
MNHIIDQHSVRNLAVGAAVLSAGGGSFPYLEHLNAVDVLAHSQPVNLIEPSTISDTARIALVAMVGAPLVALERILDAEHFVRPVRALEQHLGARFDAIMGYEIGSLNAMVPVMVAAKTGLPLIDADTFGRSFPQSQMTSFSIAGVPMTPLVVSDIRENNVIITESVNGDWTECMLRAVTTSLGSIAAICGTCSGATLMRHGIAHTYSRAIRLGTTLLAARATQQDVVTSLLSAEAGVVIARGKVMDVDRRVSCGFVRGQARIVSEGERLPVVVHFQNEYSVVTVGGSPVSTVPDLICVLDTVHGEPIGTESLRYSQQVAVVSLPAMAVHCTPAALDVVGPRGFGYDFDYVTPHTRTAS